MLVNQTVTYVENQLDVTGLGADVGHVNKTVDIGRSRKMTEVDVDFFGAHVPITQPEPEPEVQITSDEQDMNPVAVS